MGDFFEADVRIEVRADWILRQRFDFGTFHALTAHIAEGVFYELAADSLALKRWVNGEIGNGADLALVVYAGADITAY